MPDDTISILIATDVPILRDALRSIIKGSKDLKLVGCSEDHEKIVSTARELGPDLVILDTSFASDSLLTVIDSIVGQNSKVLLIGGEMDHAQIIEALYRGASGVIGRKSTPDLVSRSIRAVARAPVPGSAGTGVGNAAGPRSRRAARRRSSRSTRRRSGNTPGCRCAPAAARDSRLYRFHRRAHSDRTVHCRGARDTDHGGRGANGG